VIYISFWNYVTFNNAAPDQAPDSVTARAPDIAAVQNLYAPPPQLLVDKKQFLPLHGA